MKKNIDNLKKILSKPQNITSGTLSIIFFTIISKLLGLFREMILAANFGTSWKLDALLVSMEPTLNIGAVFAGNIALIMLPIYITEKNKNNPTALKEYTSQMLFVSSFFLIGLGVVFTIFPEFFIRLFAPNFSGESFIYAVEKMRLTGILPLIQGINSLGSSIIQAERKYMLSSVIQLVFNLVAIPLISILGVIFFEVGYLYAFIIATIVMDSVILYTIRDKLSFKKGLFFFKNSVVKETVWLAIPLLLGGSLGIINGIVDNAFASYLDSGSITSMRFAQNIRAMIQSVIIGSIITTVFTDLSISNSNNDLKAYENRLKSTSSSLLHFIIPLTFWLILMARTLVSLLYERGNFTSNSTDMVTTAFVGYSTILIITPLSNLLLRVFSTKKQTKIPLLTSIIGIFMNFLFNSLLIERYGILGISISTSLVALINFIILSFFQKKLFKLSFINLKQLLIVLFSTISIFLLCYLIKDTLNNAVWLLLTNSLFLILFLFFNRSILKGIYSKLKHRKTP